MSYQTKYRRKTRAERIKQEQDRKEHFLLIHHIDLMTRDNMSKSELLELCPAIIYGTFPATTPEGELIDVEKLVDIKLTLKELRALKEKLQDQEKLCVL